MGSYVAAPPAHRAQEDRHGNEPLTNGQGHGSRAPAFSFVCLGVGGGPLETNCSGYLMKPADQPWSAGTTLVEAGSWLGSLVELLRDPATSPLHDADFPPGLSPEAQAEHVNAWVNQALISHGHLDHIFGLVLASTAQRVQRPVYGLQDTLDTILSVFNGRVWPKLASYDQQDPMAFYHLRPYVALLTQNGTGKEVQAQRCLVGHAVSREPRHVTLGARHGRVPADHRTEPHSLLVPFGTHFFHGVDCFSSYAHGPGLRRAVHGRR